MVVPQPIKERFVLTTEYAIPPSEIARICGLMDEWIRGKRQVVILQRGMKLEKIDDPAVYLHCVFCGLYNRLGRVRCEGCNAPLN